KGSPRSKAPCPGTHLEGACINTYVEPLCAHALPRGTRTVLLVSVGTFPIVYSPQTLEHLFYYNTPRKTLAPIHRAHHVPPLDLHHEIQVGLIVLNAMIIFNEPNRARPSPLT